MAKPEENNIIIDKSNFDNFKKNEQVIEAQNLLNAYYLILTKELNKCLKNPTTGTNLCYLNAVVECEGDEDCSYNIFFDHSKKEIRTQRLMAFVQDMRLKRFFLNIMERILYILMLLIV